MQLVLLVNVLLSRISLHTGPPFKADSSVNHLRYNRPAGESYFEIRFLSSGVEGFRSKTSAKFLVNEGFIA